MSRFILFALLLTTLGTLQAQRNSNYKSTFSGGILAGANFTKFRIQNDESADLEYKMRQDFLAGAWFNVPVTKCLSLEPELIGSRYYYKSDDSESLMSNARVWYFSVPVLVKWTPLEWLAVTVGPEFNLRIDVEDYTHLASEDDLKKTNVALNSGIELFPHTPVTLFGRYVHGFTSMDDRDGAVIDYYNQAFQAGLKIRLFGKRVPLDKDGDGVYDMDDACPEVAGLARYDGCPIPDTDGDGVNDEFDQCPDIIGIAKYDGCPIPDTDGDGVNDEEDGCITVPGLLEYRGCPIPDSDGDGIDDVTDACPNQAGLEKYRGCPVPDTDGDGVNDEEDACADVAGLAQYKGCPAPDRDKDGIEDGKDLCPDMAGVAEAHGCPKLDYDGGSVTFATGSAAIQSGLRQELNAVASYMEQYDALKIRINGHTDSTGSDAINMPLSQSRADASKRYLVGKGIDGNRIRTEGFGPARPVADNDTREGRRLNRRIEIIID